MIQGRSGLAAGRLAFHPARHLIVTREVVGFAAIARHAIFDDEGHAVSGFLPDRARRFDIPGFVQLL
jgi:hypothetical protein